MDRPRSETDSQSVFVSFGVIHKSLFETIARMKYSRARKYLKGIFLTKSEQDELIRKAKELHSDKEYFRMEDPDTPEARWKCLDNPVF